MFDWNPHTHDTIFKTKRVIVFLILPTKFLAIITFFSHIFENVYEFILCGFPLFF